MKNERVRKWLIIIAVFALLYLGWRYYQNFIHHAHEKHPIAVSLATVTQRPMIIHATTIGTIQPINTVAVKSMVTGQIMRVYFAPGANVKAGDPLFDIDARPFQVQLLRAEAALARDQAQLDNNSQTLRRNLTLRQKGYLSQQDYDQSHVNVAVLSSTIKADQTAIADAQLQIAYCNIKAPISGRTGNVLVQAGNLVKANDTNALVVINQITPIDVSFSLPQQYLSSLKETFNKKEKIITTLSAQSHDTATAPLTFIDNTVDTSTGTIMLRATIANENQAFWPGEFVRVEVPVQSLPHALVIPTIALQQGPDGSYVFLLSANQTVKIQAVTAGATEDDTVIIEKGLSVGQRVVTRGVLRLVDGSQVDVQ